MKKKISVIVCVYNGEKYIDQCITSITNQTIGMENLQIVLVNDASTDSTLEKMKEWEKKYPEDITIITYEINKRLGGARNVGLQYCTGEFVGYVDCDDWIEPIMYETMYQKAKKYECEVVRCKFSRDADREGKRKKSEANEDIVYEKKNFKEEYPFWQNSLYMGKNGLCGSCWAGIYKRDFLIKHNIFFPENVYYEDNFWEQLLSLYIVKMCVVDQILYHYYVNHASITMQRNDEKHLERLDVEMMILEELKKRGIGGRNSHILERNFIIRFYLNTMHIVFTRFDKIPDIFPYMKGIILQEFPNYKENKYFNEFLTPTGKVLLKLLDSAHVWSVEELEVVKEKYVELFEGSIE